MTLLHDFLRVQAAATPDADAVVLGAGAGARTYRETDRAADRVAAGLAAMGVVPGDRVVLCLERSLDLVPALVGLLRSGATCIPVDPEDPAERRRAILEQSGARYVLTQASLAPSAAGESTRGQNAAGEPGLVGAAGTLLVEDALAADPAGPGLPPGDVAADPESVAFIFYTSGSTGVPKGVVLTHRALVSGQQWLRDTFVLEPGDRQLLRTTLSITNLVREVFWPLLAGGTIVVVPPGAHRDPERMLEIVRDERVATLLVVPALLAGMLSSPGFASASSLKYVFCSSDVMPGDLPERYFATGATARLFNLYGLTEALYSTCWECLPGTTYPGFVPVGYPAELTPLILGEDGEALPAGEVGELCLAGAGIASGYDGLPDLTAAKFVTTAAGPTFRTGDLARQQPDGCLDLLGRRDTQVKISGYRVELGEVESALRALPGVADAVAAGVRDDAGHQRLVAYLTAEPAHLTAAPAHLTAEADDPAAAPAGLTAAPADAVRDDAVRGDAVALTAAGLRAALERRLPAYMVPARYVVVDALPLTHNGKVDRMRLGDLRGHVLAVTGDRVAPRTPVEEALCRLWAEVLGVDAVGIDDNFFALGGDSIQGFLISAAARRQGWPLDTTQVFRTPTVRRTAEYLEETGPVEPGPGDGELVVVVDPAELARVAAASQDPAGVERVYPLTEMQKGMLFHSLLDPSSGVYLEQFLYAIDGDLDVGAYHAAWQGVVDRHEILRVWIATHGLREPLQAVQRDVELEWTVLDWSSSGADAQQGLLEDFLREDRRRGFPYDRAPLFRLALLKLGPDRHRLVMTYHHLILDAWSLYVMLRDSLEIYAAASSSREPRLPEPRSFGDYVAWLRGEDLEAAHGYWVERLKGLHRATVIGSNARLGLSASSQDLHAEARLDLGRPLTDALHGYGREQHLTLNSMVQGAWALVVAALSAQDDVCFGITITHRPVGLRGVEDIVGIFINSLPMRVSVDPAAPVADWLQSVQANQVAARAHDHYPLPLIQEHTELPSGQPLFETLLIFENFPRGEGWSGLGGLDVRQERYVGWTNYPFAIEAMPEDELFFQVKYDLAFFDEARVGEVLAAFRAVFEAMVAGTGATVGQLLDVVRARAAVREPLPAPADHTPARGRAAVPAGGREAAGDDEAELAGIWGTVLGLPRVPVDVPFLELGGSSLAAMRIAVLAQDAGFDLELVDLFGTAATVERLAGTRADELEGAGT